MNQLVLTIGLFVVCIVCLGMGNTLLKVGMGRFGTQTDAGVSFFQALLHSPQLPLGVVLMAIEFVGSLILFKWGWDVSVVIPIMGLSYVVTAFLGKFMLGEPVDAVRWLGIILIIAGVMFVVHSVTPAKS
jgi:threonine/homoserine efflux transporter RhtA